MHGSLKTLTVIYLHAKLHFPNLNSKVIFDMANFHPFRVIVTGTDFLFETLFSLAVKMLFAEKTEHFKIFVCCFLFSLLHISTWGNVNVICPDSLVRLAQSLVILTCHD